MDAFSAHSYNTLVKLEREPTMKGNLRGGGLFFLWWPSTHLAASWRCHCSSSHHTDWHLLEVITFCWDHALRCITIGDVGLVPTLEKYDRFLSLSTLLNTVFVPPVWTRYRKRLTNLMGFKRLVHGGADFVWQRDRREHVLWVLVWSVPFIAVPYWLPRWFCGFGGVAGILSMSGLPGGLLWCNVIPFTIRSCRFCRSPSSECPASWYLFHSCFTFWDL